MSGALILSSCEHLHSAQYVTLLIINTVPEFQCQIASVA